MWFEGSVGEAIAASRQEGKPLIVLLTGVPPGTAPVKSALPVAWYRVYKLCLPALVLTLQDLTRAAARCRTR